MGMGKEKARVTINMSHQQIGSGDCLLLRCDALPGNLLPA